MKLTFTPYAHSARAFSEIEEFASLSFRRFDPPRNWLVDRWNFTMTVSRVMHGASVEDWERGIGLWRDEGGVIRAIAHEEEQRGDVFFEFSDAGVFSPELFAEMIAFAERSCCKPRGDGLGFALRVPQGHELLVAMALARGYAKLEWSEPMSARPAFRGGSAVAPPPPAGLHLAVGREIAPEAKALAHAWAFGYAERSPEQIPISALAFTELLNAPSYREDLDLALVTADGRVAAFVGLWVDPAAGYAILEPVGTIPEYRRRGLASWLIDEGERRVTRLGARRLFVGSDQPFYRAIGFETVLRQDLWEYRRP